MQYKDLLFHSSGCYGQSKGHLKFSSVHVRWKSFQERVTKITVDGFDILPMGTFPAYHNLP